MKPRVLVASSSEKLAMAIGRAIQVLMDHEFDVTIWHQQQFRPGMSTMESIQSFLASSSYGIFVFAPDDELTTRGETVATVRGNVIFEMGMFAGVREMRRTFYIVPRDKSVSVISDLDGITPVDFDLDRFKRDGAPALGSAVSQIAHAIQVDQITYPKDRHGKPNILAMTTGKLVAEHTMLREQPYCLAADVTIGKSLKVTLKAVAHDKPEELGMSWSHTWGSPSNKGFEPAGMMNGQQDYNVFEPSAAFLPISFRPGLRKLLVEIYENGAEEPTRIQEFVVS